VPVPSLNIQRSSELTLTVGVAAWFTESIVKEAVAVAVLPATSVLLIDRLTAPSDRPSRGIVPEVGVCAARSMLQAPVASVVAL